MCEIVDHIPPASIVFNNRPSEMTDRDLVLGRDEKREGEIDGCCIAGLKPFRRYS